MEASTKRSRRTHHCRRAPARCTRCCGLRRRARSARHAGGEESGGFGSPPGASAALGTSPGWTSSRLSRRSRLQC
eukprot:scaffold358_cov256-Pinguiococcus_pyrenoidosus.AAC.12